MTCWTEIPSLGDINQYLKAIDKFPLLTAEEEKEAVNEGELGQHKLILSHLRLASSIAREYMRTGLPLIDLIQEANIGLVKAVKGFDATKARFTSYAIPWIKAELHEFMLRYSKQVRVATTKNQRKLMFNLGALRAEKFKVSGSYFFTDEDVEHIAAMLDVKVEEVREMEVRLIAEDCSFDQQLDDESYNPSIASAEIDHSLRPDVLMEKASRMWLETEGVKEALEVLDERERFIIEHRYMVDEPLTLIDLGKIFDVSFERVRQLEVRGLKKMRAHLKEFA